MGAQHHFNNASGGTIRTGTTDTIHQGRRTYGNGGRGTIGRSVCDGRGERG